MRPPPNLVRRGGPQTASGIIPFRFHTRIRGAYLAWMWNLPAWLLMPVGYVELSEYGWGELVFVPPLIGIALAWAALRRYCRYKRDGLAVLHLEPSRPRVGASFRARFVAAAPSTEDRVITAWLRCQKTRYGAESASSRTIWSVEQHMTMHDGIAEAVFVTTADLPASLIVKQADTSFDWKIDVDRGGYRQEYNIILAPAQTIEGLARRRHRMPNP